MKLFAKNIALLITIVMIMSLLAACEPADDPAQSGSGSGTNAPTPSETESEPGEEPLPPAEDMKIIEGGKSSFKIVRGENAADFENTRLLRLSV